MVTKFIELRKNSICQFQKVSTKLGNGGKEGARRRRKDGKGQGLALLMWIGDGY